MDFIPLGGYMTTGEWVVAGRNFRSKYDYEMALKEEIYIEQIKKRYHLDNIEDIKRLLNDLQTEKYRFRTILGQDFLEEIQELLQDFEKSKQKEKNKNRNQNKIKVQIENFDPQMQKIVKQELKKQDNKRKMLIFICMGVVFFCFGYLIFYYYLGEKNQKENSYLAQLKEKAPIVNNIDTGIEVHYDDGTVVLKEILDEYINLYNKNKKLIGWVKIDDTNIDYPVLQTANNEYYLDHNFEQEYDKNGSIFLDKDCDILNRSTNLIIYGHHMSNGKMFGKLNKYTSKDYYKDHKYIQFDTIYDKGTYEVMYVFRSKIYEEKEIVFKYYQFIDVNSETEFDSYMNEMSEMSLYDTGVTAKYGDELITLSTCDYYTDYGRFVVVAKRIK